jgi:hypothetical protein
MVALSVMIPRPFRAIAHKSSVSVVLMNCQAYRVHTIMEEIGTVQIVPMKKKTKIGWRQNEKVPKVPTTKDYA